MVFLVLLDMLSEEIKVRREVVSEVVEVNRLLEPVVGLLR